MGKIFSQVASLQCLRQKRLNLCRVVRPTRPNLLTIPLYPNQHTEKFVFLIHIHVGALHHGK